MFKMIRPDGLRRFFQDEWIGEEYGSKDQFRGFHGSSEKSSKSRQWLYTRGSSYPVFLQFYPIAISL